MKKVLLFSCLVFAASITFGQKVRSPKQPKTTTQSRSAKSGQYVTKEYADKHKSTTYTSRKRGY